MPTPENDSAPRNVTVRRIFSDGPATGIAGNTGNFGGLPLPSPRNPVPSGERYSCTPHLYRSTVFNYVDKYSIANAFCQYRNALFVYKKTERTYKKTGAACAAPADRLFSCGLIGEHGFNQFPDLTLTHADITFSQPQYFALSFAHR